ncbi:acyl-ACP--UDP-N-acetylglucosamine O-acyltransferase [Alienimonas californiensis]|nr:acyl-ACP--UDP-N-acetylglucosamine O-acyltransferase [Alienimonas californiensis]
MPKPALFGANEMRASRPAARAASISIHPLSDVHPQAVLGAGTKIGPFCTVGPDVVLGSNNTLDSHVVLSGPCAIGSGNRFWPGCVIGGEPQDKGWHEAPTGTVIGDDNQFREGVTVHRGAEKEDGVTRIGSRCLLMSNAHVAHNCRVGDDCMLVNGVLLGGHVHMHDGAIVSGNSVVHHFATVGTLAFVSGGGKLVRDLPPYMLSAGTDNPTVKTVNLVGMQRAGIPDVEIRGVKLAHRLLYRSRKPIAEIRKELEAKFGGECPPAVERVLSFVENQSGGRNGRGRDGKKVPYEPVSIHPIRRAA